MTDASAGASRRTPVLARLETFTALGVVAVLALLLAAYAFTRPTAMAEERAIAYQQTATFSYSAVTAADSFYGSGGLEPGETIVIDEVDAVRMRVDYALETGAQTSVDGTAKLTAVVAVTGGLRRTFRIGETSVDGTGAVLEDVLPLEQMRSYLERSRSFLGDAGAAATATVTLAPVIDVTGTVDGRTLQTSYEPTLDLLLTDDTLAVVTDGAEPVTADAKALNPSQAGEVTYEVTAPETLPLLVADPRVSVTRWFALGLLLGCLAAMMVLGRRLFGRDSQLDEAAHILTLHGSRVVSVERLDLRDGPVAHVAGFEALLELARRYDSVIMHLADDRGHTFLLWDTGLTYRYRSVRGRAGSTSGGSEDAGADPVDEGSALGGERPIDAAPASGDQDGHRMTATR